MERDAIIVKREGGVAYLKLDSEGGCGRCAQPGGCSTGLLNEVLGPRCELHRVPDAPQFKVGDRVRLITPDGVVWRAAFLLYLVPLVVGLVGAAVGAARSDAFAMAGLVAGLLLGVGCSRVLISRRLVAPVRPIVRPFAADDFQHIEFVKFVRDSTQ